VFFLPFFFSSFFFFLFTLLCFTMCKAMMIVDLIQNTNHKSTIYLTSIIFSFSYEDIFFWKKNFFNDLIDHQERVEFGYFFSLQQIGLCKQVWGILVNMKSLLAFFLVKKTFLFLHKKFHFLFSFFFFSFCSNFFLLLFYKLIFSLVNVKCRQIEKTKETGKKKVPSKGIFESWEVNWNKEK
jgi:hypothetical protein